MPAITEGVEFTTVAREIRCKWSPDNDMASLKKLQEVLNANADALKAVPGCSGVKRIVCGGCQDFKIITAVSAENFGDWEGKSFAPEADILAAMKAIEGVSTVETQTYTFMDV